MALPIVKRYRTRKLARQKAALDAQRAKQAQRLREEIAAGAAHTVAAASATASTVGGSQKGCSCAQGGVEPRKLQRLLRKAEDVGAETTLKALMNSVLVLEREQVEKLRSAPKHTWLLKRYNITVATPGEARKMNLTKTIEDGKRG